MSASIYEQPRLEGAADDTDKHENPQLFQHFASAGLSDIVREPIKILARLDDDGEQHFVLWSDVQQFFPNAIYVLNGAEFIPFLMDDDFQQIKPLRIAYHPGVVLWVTVAPHESPAKQDFTLESPGETSSFDKLSFQTWAGLPWTGLPSTYKDSAERSTISECGSSATTWVEETPDPSSFYFLKPYRPRKRIEKHVQQTPHPKSYYFAEPYQHPPPMGFDRRMSNSIMELQRAIRRADSYVGKVASNEAEGLTELTVETSHDKDPTALKKVKPEDKVPTQEIDYDLTQLTNEEQIQKRLELLKKTRLDLQLELQVMGEKYRESERRALLCLAEMRRRITAILDCTYELQEDPKPRLFIVLLTRSVSSNIIDTDPSTNFRLYFLCECSTDTNSEDDNFSQGIHLVKHEGYEIRNSDEFIQKYGPYVLTMLQMVKYGFVATGFTAPALAHYKQIEGIDAIQQTLDISQATIGSLVDDSIAFIRDQVAKMTDRINVPTGSPELDNQEVLEEADLQLLESHLEINKSNHVLGNLCQIVDSEGYLKWVCVDHYHNFHEMSVIKELREIVIAGCNGQFIEEKGLVDVRLQTSIQAEQFYSAMIKARCIFDLKVSLLWNPTQDDLNTLAKAVTKANIARLRITGCSGIEGDRSIRRHDELDSTLFRPILQSMSNGKLQAIEFYGLQCSDFLYVDVSEMKSSPRIRELSVEWTATPIVDHETTFTAILGKCLMLVKLIVKTDFAQDVLVYMLRNISLYPRLKTLKIKDIGKLNYSFEFGISHGRIHSLDVLSFGMCHWELGGMKELLLGGFLTEIDLTLNGDDTDLDRLRAIVRHNPKLTRAGLCIDRRYVEVIVCADAATRDNLSETGDINILRGLEQQIHRWRGGAQPGTRQGRSSVQHL
ncbi:hypothetical protein BGZ98_009937 [Dissophora globulifera]|nr:hypothetical protein BGZ98_009937 [Dissophora globulifera]